MRYGRSEYPLLLSDKLMARVQAVAARERKWTPNVVAALLREALAAREIAARGAK